MFLLDAYLNAHYSKNKTQESLDTKATGKLLKICILYNVTTMCTYINAKPPMKI